MAGSTIDFVNVRHEQVAAHAADGYARVTGRASVVLSHLSPGLTNAATGVANAALDCIPMVVIAGDVPSHYFGRHPHQEVNLHADGAAIRDLPPVRQAGLARRHAPTCSPRSSTRHSSSPSMANPARSSSTCRWTSSPHPSTRHCSPASTTVPRPCTAGRSTSRRPDDRHRLAEAERPVLYVGGGVLLSRASDELRRFVDHLGIPVAYSLMGKGALSDDHPLTLGMTGFWGTELVNNECLAADVILAIGTRFKEADSSSWYRDYTFNIPDTALLHVDIEASEINRVFPAEIGAVADARSALRVLDARRPRAVPRRLRPSRRAAQDRASSDRSSPIATGDGHQ